MKLPPPFQDAPLSGSPPDRPCPGIVESEASVPESNQQELISVIVPVYNVEDYLPNCLDTILRQTYKNLEIILVDDGSTDNSGKICDKFAEKDNRVIVFHCQNKGAWAARNVGLHEIHGEYIMFVDSDDYMHLTAVSTMYKAINQDGGYDIAAMCAKGTEHLDEDIVSAVEGSEITLGQEDVYRQIQQFSAIWGKLYRRSLIGGLLYRPFRRAHDYDFNIRVFQNLQKCIWVRKTLYYYVQNPGSLVHEKDGNVKGREFQVRILADNLTHLQPQKNDLRHYLLKELYLYMAMLTTLTYGTEKYPAIQQLCREYVCQFRRQYWVAKDISLVEKLAMTLNIRHPHFVRVFKNTTKGRLSWHLLGKF